MKLFSPHSRSLCRCLVGLSLLAGCVPPGPELVEGGIYSTPNEDGSFAVVKILKLDEKGVHVRVYSNRFETRPDQVDESLLYMAGIDHKPDESLGMGHLPLSRSSFAGWKPRWIQQSTVVDDELEGYKMWSEASGNYF